MNRRACRVAIVARSLMIAIAGFVGVPAEAELSVSWIHDYNSNGNGYPIGVPLPARTLSLTIDDGPGALTLPIGQLLHDRGIRATFFVNGNRFAGNEAALDAIAELNHQIGNHTETHFRLTDDPTRAPQEVRAVMRRIEHYLGNGFHPFRPPYAQWNAAVHTALASDEFDIIAGPFWHEIAGPDYACLNAGLTPALCAGDDIARLLARPNRNGTIILHEHVEVGYPSYHFEVVEALLDRIAALPGQPYVWVPLDAIPGVVGGLSAGPMALWSAAFSDAAGFAASAYSATLRAGDVDGDGDDDVCARQANGVVCALSDGATLGAATLWSTTFSDAAGFNQLALAATLQLADVNGDGAADLCMRAITGLVCETSNGVSGFDASLWGSVDFADAAGFGSDESRYRSLRMADVNGDARADVCARDGAGVRCALAMEDGFAPASSWSARLGDGEGFGAPEYGATLALGDLDGDGRADLCVRASSGISCGLSDGGSFADPTSWLHPTYTDAEGWIARSRFLSLRLGDIDGDGKADVCGRNATGVECARSDGVRFRDIRYTVNTNFLDAQGWDTETRGPTLLLAHLDGTGATSVCGRAAAGLVCHRAPLDLDHDGFGDPRDNCPELANPAQEDVDADGIGDLCEPACLNGIDDDGDGNIDFPADPGCSDALDDAERSASLACDDGIDNDGDGMIDWPSDPGCRDLAISLEDPACQDGIDNDGDGSVDFDGGASRNGGVPLAAPDPHCGGIASGLLERHPTCGLGVELVFVLPLLIALRSRSQI